MDFIKDIESKTLEAVKHFKEQISSIRGGRATPKLVENINIDYYGQKLLIKQAGSISAPSPKEINILVWDNSTVPLIVKAVESALNINAVAEGNLIRINFPPLSEERRKEFIKLVKKEAEGIRIRIRAIRDEANKKINLDFEEKKISEDEKFKTKEKIQKITDEANKEIENCLENKIKEIEEQ